MVQHQEIDHMNATLYSISKESDNYFYIAKDSIQYAHVSKESHFTTNDSDYQFFINDTGGGTLDEYAEWFAYNRKNKQYVEPKLEEKANYTINIVLTNGFNLLFVTDKFELVSSIDFNEDITIYYGV